MVKSYQLNYGTVHCVNNIVEKQRKNAGKKQGKKLPMNYVIELLLCINFIKKYIGYIIITETGQQNTAACKGVSE